MKVAITNTVSLNGGDAAILRALMGIARRAWGEDTEFVVFDSHAAVAQKYYPDIAFQSSLWETLKVDGRSPTKATQARVRAAAAAVRVGLTAAIAGVPSAARSALTALCAADVVISTGGTYLVEHYDLRHRWFDFEVCLAMGKKTIFFTQSMGPFHQPQNRAAARRLIGASPMVLLRDVRSRENLIDIGVPPRDLHICADSVFADANVDAIRAGSMSAGRADRPRIAISVRDWKKFGERQSDEGMEIYLSSVAGLAEHLVEQYDADVVFLSTCQGVPEYWAHDEAVAAKVARRLKPSVQSRITVDDAFHDPDELRQKLRAMTTVIATRMHMAILSVTEGIPCLPIAYEFKTLELYAELGAADWVVPIETITPTGLIAQFDRFWHELPDRRVDFFKRVLRGTDRANKAVRLFWEVAQ